MADENQQISKKVCAGEVLKALFLEKRTLYMNLVLAFGIAIVAFYNAKATAILAVTSIIFNILELQRIGKYEKYLKEKYSL